MCGIYTIEGNSISWSSKTQTRTAILTAEAKYYNISQGAQDLLFMQNILGKMGLLEEPEHLLGDSNESIQLVRNR